MLIKQNLPLQKTRFRSFQTASKCKAGEIATQCKHQTSKMLTADDSHTICMDSLGNESINLGTISDTVSPDQDPWFRVFCHCRQDWFLHGPKSRDSRRRTIAKFRRKDSAYALLTRDFPRHRQVYFEFGVLIQGEGEKWTLSKCMLESG